MAKSPEQLAHEQWLGYIQPEGLVVSIPALLEARAHINQNFLPRHRALLEFLPKDRAGQPIGELPGFLPFAESILGWSQADIAGAPQGPALPETLQFYLRDYGETLQPTYAVRDSARDDSELVATDRRTARWPGFRYRPCPPEPGNGRPARKPALSACCAKRRCRPACWSTSKPSAWSTLPRGEIERLSHLPSP